MKTLAAKVELFVDRVLSDASCPKYFSTVDDEVRTRPCIRVLTSTGWHDGYEYQHGERTADVSVVVESSADETSSVKHDQISALVENNLSNPNDIDPSAASVSDFTLVRWRPGTSETNTTDRVRQTVFTFSARIRNDSSLGV